MKLRRTDRDYVADAIGAILGSGIAFVIALLGLLLLVAAGGR